MRLRVASAKTTVAVAAAVACWLVAFLPTVTQAGSFPGDGAGEIPDGLNTCGAAGNPLDVTFDVFGISTINDISIAIDFSHTWVADVDARLIAPDATEHVLFARTLATTGTGCGDDSDLAGVYEFSDDGGPVHWWQAAADAVPPDPDVVAVGDYRTTEPGPETFNPPETVLLDAFSGVSQPNGTWTLLVRDVGKGDTGWVNAAALTINAGECPDLLLMDHTVTGSEVEHACGTITTGANYWVASSGVLTLRAGSAIELRDGFAVAQGGKLKLDIEPAFNPTTAALDQSRRSARYEDFAPLSEPQRINPGKQPETGHP